MTNDTPPVDYQQDEEEARGWHGLIAFATYVLLLVGAFHIVGGFVALFEDDVYEVPSRDLVISVDYNVWGIAHMALGLGMILASYALFWGKTWGRVVTIAIVMVSAVTNLAFLSAAPVWYTMMIVLDILVIYAVTVYGGDNREY